MVPYLILFSIPALLALGSRPKYATSGEGRLFLGLYSVFIALMIGFRWEVGGDWSWDVRRMMKFQEWDLLGFMQKNGRTDPGFAILMWFVTQTGYNVWLLHLIGGGIFAYGLFKFCLNENHPWLSMTVAIPYLVIVVAMGYDRQAIAIGFVMLALVALQNKSLSRFVINMLFAATMHVTALIVMPLGVFASRINKTKALIFGGPIFATAFIYLLQDRTDAFMHGYIATGYSSSGALIRVMMNAVPASLFLLFRRRFDLTDSQRAFANTMSVVALLFVVALAVSPSSTAVDRMALYIIPLQLFVLGRLPFALTRSTNDQWLLVAGVVAYSAAVLGIWLTFADNSSAWVPYSLIDSDRLTGLSY